MTFRNYGPSVSGYLDPEHRAWEIVTYGADKPILDKELNLEQDLGEGFSGPLFQDLPSGWLSRDGLDDASAASVIFVPSATPNTLQLNPGMLAHVNGWLVLVDNTGGSGTNTVSLGAGPAGAGGKRVDLVVLEVWRRLIPPAPDTTGKSPAARIWRDGNVKVAPADDVLLNFPDDILDVAVGSESTKRVQIQYRLRVVQGVDLFSYPDGMGDPAVVARTVPPNAATPDGVAPGVSYPYVFQGANGDTGLWRAGSGDAPSAADLGTVDGYMYAIPLCAVFRRNTTAFNKNSNHNGGVAFPGPSDRPDGLFSDILNLQDLADLRRLVTPQGWSLPEVLTKNTRFLLDNTLSTEWEQTPNGNGVWGHTNLWADEIGLSNTNGGDGVVTGDTPGATFLGEFDNVRRRYSDRAIYEVAFLAVSAAGPWFDGQTFTLQPTSFPVYPYGSFNWASYAPGEVRILDILEAQFVGAGIVGQITVDAPLALVSGLGTDPVGPITVKLGAVAALGVTGEVLYLKVLVAYPPGGGLTRTPVASYPLDSSGVTGAIQINNPVQLPAVAPILYDSLSLGFDQPHREVDLEYVTLSQTITFNTKTGLNLDTFGLPERAEAIILIEKATLPGAYAPIVGAFTLDSSGTSVTLANPADFTNTGDALRVTFTARRPLPQNGEQLTVYYPSRAPQGIRSGLLGVRLKVYPRLIQDTLGVITTGSGSQGEGYPFPYGYVQTGGVFPTSVGVFGGEHELDGTATLAVADFNADTGWLKLPTFIGLEAMSILEVTRSPGDEDIEGRSYFTGVLSGYRPNAYAQQLSLAGRHKVVLPFLGELVEEGTAGHRGALVLGVFTRWADDENNDIVFDPDLTQSTTSLGLFRVKGNLLGRKS